uniref:Uncharacterized protein n=1 Tax=Arundo donax TaxID=35708 RepID=A0A0A9DQC0_ARUDO
MVAVTLVAPQVLGSTRHGSEFKQVWVKKKAPRRLFRVIHVTTAVAFRDMHVAHVFWAPCGVSGQPAFGAFSRPGQEELLLNAKPWGRSFPHRSSFFLIVGNVLKLFYSSC